MSSITIILVVAVIVLLGVLLILGTRPRRNDGEFAPGPRTVLPVIQADPSKRCETCAHFDLEDGQAMAMAHGPFAMAAQHVPPFEMGAVATPEGAIEPRDIPAKASWGEFGLCCERNEGIWGPTTAERRARMQDDDGIEGGFLVDGEDCYEAAG